MLDAHCFKRSAVYEMTKITRTHSEDGLGNLPVVLVPTGPSGATTPPSAQPVAIPGYLIKSVYGRAPKVKDFYRVLSQKHGEAAKQKWSRHGR